MKPQIQNPKTSTSIFSSLLMAAVFILSVGCGKKESNGRGPDGADTDANIAASVVSTVGSTSLEAETPSHGLKLNLTGAVPACKIANARGICSGDTLKAKYSKCATSAGNSWLEGEWTAQYSPAPACDTHQKTNDLVDGAQALKRTAKFAVHGSSSDLIISSDNRVTKAGTIGGGIGLVKSTENRETLAQISILGLHKVTQTGSSVISNISLHTNGNVVKVYGTKWANTRHASGIVNVENNQRKSSMVISLEAVKWQDSKCCYPSAGSVRVDTLDPLSKKVLSTSRLSFDPSLGCGMASFKNAAGKTQSTSLSFCEE